MSENNQLELKIKEVASRIIAVREDIGMSEAELAQKAGVTKEELQALLSGQKDFSFTFIYKCAKACGVEITDLLEGQSPALSTYTLTRKGEGQPIARRAGFSYNRLAPYFKGKIAEPFLVRIPYDKAADERNDIKLSTHAGQELDIILHGSAKFKIDGNFETLSEGDSIYYESSTPHGMIATNGSDLEMYAIVMNASDADSEPTMVEQDEKTVAVTNFDAAKIENPVADKFIKTTVDENGVVNSIEFTNEEKFNFSFDIIDELAKKCPDKLCMIYVSKDKEERRYTFAEMKEYCDKTANFFASLGITKGDKVMLVLKRHRQFWFSMLALHKLGAVAIPASNMLVEHDFVYRFDTADVKAIVCTSDGDTAKEAELAAEKSPRLEHKIIVGNDREGWLNFDTEIKKFDGNYERRENSPCGSDDMLMLFTSGTTGQPKSATHNYKYALGHFLTAKYWHNVDPNGIHFTISDTGWGKALWGKLYGQWMNETAIFVYDFDKFDAHDILPMFAKYNITTFCAPPTMYRFFIKEDLSKYDLSSIKHATIAGEALNPEVFEQWKAATGLKLMEGFGQTESTLTVANFVGMNPKPGSMGKPSPLYDVDIVDADGKSCKTGETGEIVAYLKDKKAPCGLFNGYYANGQKNFEAGETGIYRTGDTAWRDEDGHFWYVGRVDDLIKSSGYRIGPFEIESVIMELPYVLECAVTGAPDPIRGQLVKATIVLTKDTEGTDELKKEIQTYVKKHTAPYKYPRVVEFVKELPKTTGSGKIRRAAIREQDNK